MNLEEDDIESIESISSSNNEDFIIKLKLKEHKYPICGSMANVIKDYKLRKIHQKNFTRFHTIIYYKVSRYLCKSCGKSFVENNPFSNGRKKTTLAMAIQILDDLKPYNSTFSSVARLYDVSITTVIDIFDKHVQIPRKRLSSILCWDEFYFNRHSKI